MKFTLLLCCLLFAAFLAGAWADDCDVKGHKFKKDDTYAPIGECVQYKCIGKKTFTAKTCPSVASLKPCKFTATDTTKPYPECCPKQDC